MALALAAGAARGDVVADVKRAFRAKEAEQRVVGLRVARGGIGDADERLRNRAAAEVEKALKSEPDPAVRGAALDLLLALRTGRAMDRLLAGLLDPDPSVRNKVHEIVRDHADPMLHRAIVRALREDASWRFRASMADLLLSGARESARRPLLQALEDPHPAVVSRAAEALFRLTGRALGTDAERWKGFFETEAQRREEEATERRTVAGEARKVNLFEGPVRGIAPTLYGIPIIEKRVVFVVDMSSSMHKTARSSHFDELKRAVFGLPGDVEFNVLCFDQRLFFFAEAKSLEPASTDTKASFERWMDDLPAGEKTDVNRSVAAGLAMLREALQADGEVKGELFLLTDGQETAKTTSPGIVEAQYGKLPQDRCRIHVIALGRHGTPALRVLAERSGGHFVEPPAR